MEERERTSPHLPLYTSTVGLKPLGSYALSKSHLCWAIEDVIQRNWGLHSHQISEMPQQDNLPRSQLIPERPESPPPLLTLYVQKALTRINYLECIEINFLDHNSGLCS